MQEFEKEGSLTSKNSCVLKGTCIVLRFFLSDLYDHCGYDNVNKDIRKVAIHNEDLTFDELLLTIQRVYADKINSQDKLLLKYKDEDKYYVTLNNDTDLKLALEEKSLSLSQNSEESFPRKISLNIYICYMLKDKSLSFILKYLQKLSIPFSDASNIFKELKQILDGNLDNSKINETNANASTMTETVSKEKEKPLFAEYTSKPSYPLPPQDSITRLPPAGTAHPTKPTYSASTYASQPQVMLQPNSGPPSFPMQSMSPQRSDALEQSKIDYNDPSLPKIQPAVQHAHLPPLLNTVNNQQPQQAYSSSAFYCPPPSAPASNAYAHVSMNSAAHSRPPPPPPSFGSNAYQAPPSSYAQPPLQSAPPPAQGFQSIPKQPGLLLPQQGMGQFNAPPLSNVPLQSQAFIKGVPGSTASLPPPPPAASQYQQAPPRFSSVPPPNANYYPPANPYSR